MFVLKRFLAYPPLSHFLGSERNTWDRGRGVHLFMSLDVNMPPVMHILRTKEVALCLLRTCFVAQGLGSLTSDSHLKEY